LERFQEAENDCRAALKLDPEWIKAHYYWGKALCELGKIEEGLKHLQQALDLTKE